MSVFRNSLKITLRNELKGKNVKVKEGNAGIFRLLTTLTPGKTYDLRHDPNATYREYILIMLPDKTELRVLSSDDFNDWKEISIYERGGEYDWMGTVPRRPASVKPPPEEPVTEEEEPVTEEGPVTEDPTPAPHGRGRFSSFFQRIGFKS
jgi:hypothetical protein